MVKIAKWSNRKKLAKITAKFCKRKNCPRFVCEVTSDRIIYGVNHRGSTAARGFLCQFLPKGRTTAAAPRVRASLSLHSRLKWKNISWMCRAATASDPRERKEFVVLSREHRKKKKKKKRRRRKEKKRHALRCYFYR
ncbi:hypothetical protein PUN28_005162 [Cardiocondyla obscurior]|uniref:Ribosomal protein S14 n=1 Tax=Cardiocondyla obscurior TaxID=286306 RepID=A0AAW2GG56_9HYME